MQWKKTRISGFPFIRFFAIVNKWCRMLETILYKYSYSDAEEYIEFALLKLRDYFVLKRILLNNDIPKPNYNKSSMDINPWFLKELVKLYPKILIDPDLKEFCHQYLIL